MGILLQAILWSSFVQAAGFAAGEQFVATYIHGNVTLVCSNPQYGSRLLNCESEILDPSEFDYFIHAEPTQATSVTLTNVIEGRKYTQTKNFNANTGRSERRFNLWISTLLQRPLLTYGENTLTYKLEKSKKTLLGGDFKVVVSKGAPRECARRTKYSYNDADCQSGGFEVCRQYFAEENYCQYH